MGLTRAGDFVHRRYERMIGSMNEGMDTWLNECTLERGNEYTSASAG